MTSLAPAWRSLSTTNEPRKPPPPVTNTRRAGQKAEPLLGTATLRRRQLFAHRVLPVMPGGELFLQCPLALARMRKASRLEVGVNHDAHELREADARRPTE